MATVNNFCFKGQKPGTEESRDIFTIFLSPPIQVVIAIKAKTSIKLIDYVQDRQAVVDNKYQRYKSSWGKTVASRLLSRTGCLIINARLIQLSSTRTGLKGKRWA